MVSSRRLQVVVLILDDNLNRLVRVLDLPELDRCLCDWDVGRVVHHQLQGVPVLCIRRIHPEQWLSWEAHCGCAVLDEGAQVDRQCDEGHASGYDHDDRIKVHRQSRNSAQTAHEDEELVYHRETTRHPPVTREQGLVQAKSLAPTVFAGDRRRQDGRSLIPQDTLDFEHEISHHDSRRTLEVLGKLLRTQVRSRADQAALSLKRRRSGAAGRGGLGGRARSSCSSSHVKGPFWATRHAIIACVCDEAISHKNEEKSRYMGF